MWDVRLAGPCVREPYNILKGLFMAIITIIKMIKKIHPDSVVLVKVGKFYNVYGRDSYIIS